MIIGSNRIFMTQTFLNRFSWISISDEFSGNKLLKSSDLRHAYCWRSSKEEELFGSIHTPDVILHSSVHRPERLVFPEVDREFTEERHRVSRCNCNQRLLFAHCSRSLSIAQASTAKLSSLFARNQPPTATATSTKLRNNLR